MKRTFLFLAILAAALTLLTGTALASSDVPEHEHWAYCNDPTVCAFCGEAYSGDNILHTYNWDDWQSDETSHWLVCTVCKEIVHQNQHRASCDAPTVCTQCGAAYTGDNISHSVDWDNWQSDETNHWHVCTVCNEISDLREHWADCSDPNVCAQCGAAYTGDNVSHSVDWDNWQSDETNHWRVCTVCSEISDLHEHWADCSDPNVCAECGVAYSGSNIRHTYDWENWQTDETSHWHVCTVCNEITYFREHWADCSDPNVCAQCGAAYTGDDVSHSVDWDNWQSDETNHWHVCTVCNEIVHQSQHWANCDAPAVCAECGAAYEGSTVNHKYDWQNWQSDETSHWHVCTVCNEISDLREHWAYCNAPTVCADCGAAYAGSEIHHKYNYEDWQWDSTGHWHTCTLCDAILWKSAHSVSCTDRTVCTQCGADCTGMDGIRFNHTYDQDNFQTDADSHWYICTVCNEIVDKYPHHAQCTVPGVCDICGAAYTGDRIVHNIEETPSGYSWETTESTHWQACTRCGEKISYGTHYAHCNAPNVCYICGADYSGNDIRHTASFNDWQSDETGHWHVCTVCSKNLEKSAHYAACDAPGVCAICGIAYTGDNIRHSWDTENWQHDENNHWHTCTKCNEILDKSGHYATCNDTDVCAACGAAYAGDDIRHNWDIESWQYDATTHWRVCKDCGTSDMRFVHRASCDDPGVCTECGVPYSGGNIHHTYNWNAWQTDGTNHWHVCALCGEIDGLSEHYAYCDSPNVCAECGIAYTGTNITHYFDWDHLEADEDSHWQVCTVCGATGTKTAHYVYCTNPNVCAECGTPCSGIEPYHNTNYDDVISEGAYHWWICLDCGAVANKSRHSALCLDPTHCSVCGAEGANMNVQHTYYYSDKALFDDDYHWWICRDCGKEIYKSEHYANCLNPTVCAECGQPYSGSNIRHNVNWNKPQHDETYHWYICMECGEEANQYKHWSYCDSPNVCEGCGVSYSGNNVQHDYYWGDVLTDGTYHWWICERCGAVADKEMHYATCDQPGICAVCEKTYTGSDIHHYTNDSSVFSHDAANHWTTCTKCGKTWTVPHDFDDDGVCVVCGYEGAHEHVWKLTASTPATCTEGGSETYTCSVCGETRTETLPSLGLGDHDWRLTASTPATCTEGGSETYTCSVCGETRTETLPSLGLGDHDWRLTASTPATCAKEGSETYTCSVCGETKNETLPSLGDHDWRLTASTPATCAKEGSETYTCSVCGETKNETLPSLGDHDWQLTASTPATCAKEGSETYTCSVCGETKNETLPGLGDHDWRLTASTPATCTEDGSEAYTCSVCDETKVEMLPGLGGHDWQQTETRPATCKEGASVTMTCSRCHIWTQEYTSSPLTHELKPVETTDATCTEDGSIVSRCDNCGETATEIIPALGHAYGVYTSDGDNSHTATCGRCGEKLSKACQMKEQKLGTLTFSICSVCGRTVAQTPAAPAENASAGTADTPAPVPVEVKVIENAAIEAVPADSATEANPEAAIPKDAVLVVLDCSAITAASANTEAVGNAGEAVPVLSTFSVSLVVDGEEFELTGAVKVRIPLTAENAPADLTGVKLVLILPSGETVDVEFEIVDGELVFTTDMLGMFAFVPVEA